MNTFQPIVMSGPSGSGKSTMVKKLMEEYKDSFTFSVSHTTRKPRPGEVDGREYHFVTREEMKKAIANNEFVEHAEFSGNMYGTSKQAVRHVMSTGRICILDIDMQGVKNVKKTDLNPRYIFVKPPNTEILEKRLRDRGTETEDSLNKRLTTAKSELEYAEQKDSYNHIIVNDDLEIAYEKLKGILIKDIYAQLPSMPSSNGDSNGQGRKPKAQNLPDINKSTFIIPSTQALRMIKRSLLYLKKRLLTMDIDVLQKQSHKAD